jgi:hypothetical protein
MLKEELVEFRRLNKYLPKVTVIHVSPRHEREIEKEVGEIAESLGISIDIAHEGEELVL